MNKYIEVSKERFDELFNNSKYKIEQSPSNQWCSMFTYFVIEIETDKKAGYFESSSYGFWYYVDLEIASKEDIVKYYEDKLKKEIDFYKHMYSIKNRVQKNSNSGPGLLEFMESDNVIDYTPIEFNIEIIRSLIQEI